MVSRVITILALVLVTIGCADPVQEEASCTQVIQKLNACFPELASGNAADQQCTREQLDLYLDNDLEDADCETLAAAGKADGFPLACMLHPFLTDAVFKSNRQPLPKNPADYSLEYQDLSFTTEDGVDLAAWLIEPLVPSDRLVIMTHPLHFTRYGFSVKDQGLNHISDVEVELLWTARSLAAAGYQVLTFDFRNHGKSGKGGNGYATMGLEEWQDVVAAVDYVKAQPALAEKKLGFVSLGMGANATIIAMSRAPERFTNLKAFIAIQPTAMWVMLPKLISDRFPTFETCWFDIGEDMEKATGYTLEDMTPLPFVGDITAPVLYVQTFNDPWDEIWDMAAMFNDSPAPKEKLWLKDEGMEHFDGFNYFSRNPAEMIDFLDRNMQ